jgi:hypothetical protein
MIAACPIALMKCMEIERPSVLLPLQQLAASIQNAVRDQVVMEGGGGMPKVP